MNEPGENYDLTGCDAECSPVELPTSRTDPFHPPRELASLREKRPVCPLRYPDGHVGWLVSDHELARALLADPRFSVVPQRLPVGDGEKNARVLDAISESELITGNMLALDPPEHARLRRSQAGPFTLLRVSEHQPSIEQIVAERLDAMEKVGPGVDLLQEFALPVASLTICEILGVPPSDRDRFERPTRIAQELSTTADARIEAMHDLGQYTRALIDQKRAQPGNDLLSDLIASGELTDEELASAAALLFGAGHETSATMLAFGTFTLLYDRTRWEALRADVSLLDNAVEELLRYLTIFHLGAFARTALEDVELDGHLITAGQSVTVSLSAANRDPKRFPDPNTFDISRDARGHVAFGHGRHICLGQHLARLEMQVGLMGLIRRFPTLHLAVPSHEVPMYNEMIIHGVERLPVAW